MALTYLSNAKILDYLFGQTAFSNLSTLYMGLSTTMIQPDGSGATEPSGGSYARVAITNNKSTFGNAASGTLQNLITISFPESTLSWGSITYAFFAAAGVTGVADIWYFEVLPTPKTVQSQTTVSFAPSAITVSMTN